MQYNAMLDTVCNTQTGATCLTPAYKHSLTGHSVSNHPKKMKFETVPPQILMKIYTFGLYGQKRRFAK